MTYQVRVYHNTTSRFMPYTDGDRLTATVSSTVAQHASIGVHEVADWAFHVYDADIDDLATEPDDADIGVLAAHVYRLIRMRSLSVGDVVAVTGHGETCWLACEPAGWRQVAAPSHIDGDSLDVGTVRPYLTGHPASHLPDESGGTGETGELHRLCVADLALTCGHIGTVALNGMRPVVVACCDRLGGSTHNGVYVAYAAEVEFVSSLFERFQRRLSGSPREPTLVLSRRSRTDDPYTPTERWALGSAGRFPARVGATRTTGHTRSPART